MTTSTEPTAAEVEAIYQEWEQVSAHWTDSDHYLYVSPDRTQALLAWGPELALLSGTTGQIMQEVSQAVGASALLVSHLHEDGSPAAGYTIDSLGEPQPWADLGALTIDDVRRVEDEGGCPGWLVDYSHGRRSSGVYTRLNDALAAAQDVAAWD